MEKHLLIGGFGGQGVMLSGQLLAFTAAETTEKYVTFFPSYGAEQRGGTANCYVVISDDEIGSSMFQFADELMVYNDPALEKFEDSVAPGGTVFINSDIVTRVPGRSDLNYVYVPALELAKEAGSERSQNLVMVGAYIGYTRLLPPEKVMLTAEKKLGKKRPQLIPINNAAFMRGMEVGETAYAKHTKK